MIIRQLMHIKHYWLNSKIAESYICLYCNAIVTIQTYVEQKTNHNFFTNQAQDYELDEIWNRIKPDRWKFINNRLEDTTLYKTKEFKESEAGYSTFI